MSCLRCTICLTSWPNKPDLFDPCPICEDKTFPISNVKAEMSLQEALSTKKHAEFDRFYEKWDASKPASRLAPTAEDHVRFPFRPKQATAAS